jgi:hypothetical protein
VVVAAVVYLIVRWMRRPTGPEDRDAEPAADVVAD